VTGITDRNGRIVTRVRKPETMKFAPMVARNTKLWSDDDKRYVLKNHSKMFVEDIADYLNRTVKAVKHVAAKMGCSIKSKPTKSEN